jgi:regulator of replication initiation timing
MEREQQDIAEDQLAAQALIQESHEKGVQRRAERKAQLDVKVEENAQLRLKNARLQQELVRAQEQLESERAASAAALDHASQEAAEQAAVRARLEAELASLRAQCNAVGGDADGLAGGDADDAAGCDPDDAAGGDGVACVGGGDNAALVECMQTESATLIEADVHVWRMPITPKKLGKGAFGQVVLVSRQGDNAPAAFKMPLTRRTARVEVIDEVNAYRTIEAAGGRSYWKDPNPRPHTTRFAPNFSAQLGCFCLVQMSSFSRCLM